jgi:hypothetical protein
MVIEVELKCGVSLLIKMINLSILKKKYKKTSKTCLLVFVYITQLVETFYAIYKTGIRTLIFSLFLLKTLVLSLIHLKN